MAVVPKAVMKVRHEQTNNAEKRKEARDAAA